MKPKLHPLPWVDETKKIKPTAIVLHWWNAPIWFGGVDWMIRRLRWRRLSVQFAVLSNGEIFQLVNDPATFCRHARCANSSSIGIEIQGFGKHDLDRHGKQFSAVVELVTSLCRQYHIGTVFRVETEPPERFYGITSHREVDKHCSGKRWFKKRDVHEDYLQRIRRDTSSKLINKN